MKQLSSGLRHLKLFFVILLGLIPLIWYRGRLDYIINGIDTNFPLDPLAWFFRRFYVWNSLANGGSDFSSSVAGIFFHLIQVVPYILGFSLTYVQILSLVFWFLVIVVNSYIFAKLIFPRSFLIQILFVVLYCFNIYLFNTWENVKVANLSLMSALPLALAALYGLGRGKIGRYQFILYTLFSAILVSGAGINPAYFICFFFILAIFLTGEAVVNPAKENIVLITKRLGVMMLAVFILNAFWILPTFDFIFKQLGAKNSIQNLGFDNWVRSLSENTSILNVLRIQGAWDWYAFDSVDKVPLYIAYALNYFYNLPFIIFSFILPGIAISAFVFRRTNFEGLKVSFGMMLLIGVFLGAGVHPPTGALFGFMASSLPFFSLFRSPWYIFTPLVVLAIAGLVSYVFYEILLRFEGRPNVREYLVIIVIGVIFSNLLYSYPLITGKIFRPGRNDSFYVKFPDYIFESDKYLESKIEGRIISYPDDEIEQYKWGYRGIESILNLFSDKETLYSALNNKDSGISRLIERFYSALKKGQIERVNSYAEKINATDFLFKRDLKSITLPINLASKSAKSIGEWDFYKFRDSKKIFLSPDLVIGQQSIQGDDGIGLLSRDEVFGGYNDSVIRKIVSDVEVGDYVVVAENSLVGDIESERADLGDNFSKTIDINKIFFKFNIEEKGSYEVVIENYKFAEFGLDVGANLTVQIDGNETVLKRMRSDDSYIYYEPINFQAGVHDLAINVNSSNLIREESIYSSSKGSPNIRVEGVGEERFLSILNKNNSDVSADLEVLNFDPLGLYIVTLQYRQIYGNNAALLIGQAKGNVIYKSQVERLPNQPDWVSYSFYYHPVKSESQMKVALIAPFTKEPLGTKVFYDNVSVRRVFDNKLFLRKRNNRPDFSTGDLVYDKVNPVRYKGQVGGSLGGRQLLIFAENYSPEWQLDLFDKQGKRLNSSNLHFMANGYANGWFIENAPSEYNFIVSYKRQGLFYAGVLVSIAGFGVILLFLLGGLGDNFFRRLVRR